MSRDTALKVLAHQVAYIGDDIEAILRARGDWDRVSRPGPESPSEP